MLGQPHACAFRPHSPVCLWLPPQHRECGPDSGSSQGGQEEEGWQPVSSLATVTQQPRGLGASPFRKQPALPYSADCFCTTSSPSGVRSGRHFLRAERGHAPSQSREQGMCPQAGFCGQELAVLGFVPRGGGRSQASLCRCPGGSSTANKELERKPGAAVSTLGTREGCKKRRP